MTREQLLERPVFICYKMKLAGYLIMKGFPLKRIAENNKDSTKTVFYFGMTEKLLDSIDEFNLNEKSKKI